MEKELLGAELAESQHTFQRPTSYRSQMGSDPVICMLRYVYIPIESFSIHAHDIFELFEIGTYTN